MKASDSSGVGASAEEADGGSRARRFENYEVTLDDARRPIEWTMGLTSSAVTSNVISAQEQSMLPIQ